jgi:hypothetical protein
MNTNEDDRIAMAVERIGRVLAAMYATQLGEIEIGVKAQKLSHCGFSNAEIAEMLGMTTNAVNIALHRARKGKKGKTKAIK